MILVPGLEQTHHPCGLYHGSIENLAPVTSKEPQSRSPTSSLTPACRMTNISSDQSDFDFWEFVSCAKCQLSFSPDAALVPFWLTECGHVICNNHLSLLFLSTNLNCSNVGQIDPDQSCSHCGSQGIQLAPLQQEVLSQNFLQDI